MNNPRRWAARLAFAAAALVLATTASAATTKSSADEIVIGYAIAKTGGFSTYDLSLQNGGKIAAAAINAKGGVLGQKIKIIDCDTKSALAQSGPCAQQLISKGADVIISTSDYDFGGGAFRAAAAKGLLAFGFAGDTRLGYHGIGPTVFNTYQGSNAEGAVEAEFAYSKGWRKPYILTDTINSYPKTVSDNFEARWKQLAGGDVAGKDLFLNSDASIATQISTLRGANPDVIVISSFPPGGASAIKQIRAAGIETPIVTDEAFDGSAWISAIPNLSNTFIPHLASADGNDPSPARNAFFKKLEDLARAESPSSPPIRRWAMRRSRSWSRA